MRILLEALKEFFRKRETYEYPLKPFQTFPEFRGLHKHDKEKCTYCGICAARCPVSAIKVLRDKKIWEVDWSKCIFCGLCEEVCPRNAIKLTNSYEKMARKKGELIYVD